MSNMRKNKDGREGISQWKIAADYFLGKECHIEINGSRRFIAEGCMGVLSCNDDQIKLNMGKHTLLLIGSDLIISAMYGQTVCIDGRINSIEFI